MTGMSAQPTGLATKPLRRLHADASPCRRLRSRSAVNSRADPHFRHRRPARAGASIVNLRIGTFPRGFTLANERAPQSIEGAQHGFRFSCALAAPQGATASQPIDPRWLREPQMLELASRIELAIHEDVADPMSRTQVREQSRRLSMIGLGHARQDGVPVSLDGMTTEGFRPFFSALDAMPSRNERRRHPTGNVPFRGRGPRVPSWPRRTS